MVAEENARRRDLLASAASSKTIALAWIRFAYLVALAVALLIACSLVKDGAESTLFIALIADLAATLVIFGFSRVFGNSSFYDAYWSVAPPVIALFWAFTPHTDEVSVLRRMVVVLLVFAWGIRLTHNWMRQWTGLDHEDWRYEDLRAKWGEKFWLIDLGGIHLFPTLQVFLGCLPLYAALSAGLRPFGRFDLFALVVTALAIWFEMTADRQLYDFVESEKEPGEHLDKGLWAYSRHPNYFGEILFWWGIYLFGLAAAPGYWWTFVGPLGITLMFIFVSIPMIDARARERRPDYEAEMGRVSACIPWFPKR